MTTEGTTTKRRSPLDLTINVIGWLVFIGLGYYIYQNYSALPEEIPTHFNLTGGADATGPKSYLWLFYVVGLAIFILLTLTDGRPEKMNYPVSITEENREQLYEIGAGMLRFLKLAIVVLWSLIAHRTIEIASGVRDGLGNELLIVSVTLIFLPILYGIIRMLRVN